MLKNLKHKKLTLGGLLSRGICPGGFVLEPFSSLVIKNYFNFGNSSFVVHFMLDQTGILFWATRYIDLYKKI